MHVVINTGFTVLVVKYKTNLKNTLSSNQLCSGQVAIGIVVIITSPEVVKT